MRLLLIFPAWCSTFGVMKNIAKKASSFPPLGLCYIAAIAEKMEWEVKIIDAEVEELGLEEIIRRTGDFKPDLIGLTATTPFFSSVAEIARVFKERFDTPIILGGVHVSIMRQEGFLDVFDYLFIGECEATFADFLSSFASGKQGQGVPGIMRRENGKVIYYGDAPKLQDLDEIPWPARHLIPYEKYFMGTLKGRKNYTSIFTSRGCPFQCVFCASNFYGRKVRRRSIGEVIREITYVVNTLQIKHIYFLDDTFTLNRKHIFDLCEAIEKHNLKFTFEGSTRANLWDEEMVCRLKEVGLIRISFGLETVDLDVRRIIKKEVPIEDYLAANRLNKKYGIETINSVMLGLPGDTRESIKRTVDFLCRARDIQHATYGIAIPYPGTEMARMAKAGEYGLKIINKNFGDYQRYGSSVMEVGGLKPEDLVALQKKGLIRIYTCWWRIWPMIKRHGIRALIVPALDAIGAVVMRGLSRVH